MKCLNLYFKKLRKAIKNCLSLQGENKIKSRSIVSSVSQIVKNKVQYSAHHLFTELFKGSSLKFYTNAYCSAIK